MGIATIFNNNIFNDFYIEQADMTFTRPQTFKHLTNEYQWLNLTMEVRGSTFIPRLNTLVTGELQHGSSVFMVTRRQILPSKNGVGSYVVL